jgi:hypothetical protein
MLTASRGHPRRVPSGLAPRPGRGSRAGTRYGLAGTGTLDPLGPVGVSGYVQSTGFTTSGHASGNITFSTWRGTLTLGLAGPTQGGFAPMPTHLYFHVLGGSGTYRHEAISGWMDFHFRPGALAATPPRSTPGGHNSNPARRPAQDFGRTKTGHRIYPLDKYDVPFSLSFVFLFPSLSPLASSARPSLFGLFPPQSKQKVLAAHEKCPAGDGWRRHAHISQLVDR